MSNSGILLANRVVAMTDPIMYQNKNYIFKSVVLFVML